MTGRHALALTNSEKVALQLEQMACADFDSVEVRLRHVDGYGWCHEISVDADEYERWLVP